MQEQERRSRGFGYSVLVISAIIWGAEGILVQLCYAAGFTLPLLLSVRYLSALPVLVVVCKYFKAPLIVPKGVRLRLLGVSVFFIAMVFMFYSALAMLPVTLAVLFFYAFPALTAIICAVTSRQPFDLPHIIALIISAAGLILLYWTSVALIPLLGLLAALGAALFQACKLIGSQSLIKELGVWSFVFNITLISAIAYTVFAVADGGFAPLLNIAPQGWLYVALLGMLVTVCGNLFMYLGIRIVGAVDASIICLLEPPSAAILAMIILGDSLTPGKIFGGFLILLAVTIPAVVELKKERGLKASV